MNPIPYLKYASDVLSAYVTGSSHADQNAKPDPPSAELLSQFPSVIYPITKIPAFPPYLNYTPDVLYGYVTESSYADQNANWNSPSAELPSKFPSKETTVHKNVLPQQHQNEKITHAKLVPVLSNESVNSGSGLNSDDKQPPIDSTPLYSEKEVIVVEGRLNEDMGKYKGLFDDFIKEMETACPSLHSFLHSNTKSVHGSIRQNVKIISPTDALLKERAQYYKDKLEYDIDMTVVSSKQSAQELRELINDKRSKMLAGHLPGFGKSTSWIEGIILSPGDDGHIMPLLVEIMPNGRAVALSLDVLGQKMPRNSGLSISMYQALYRSQTKYALPIESRQGDRLSCRVGAPVTLRNAKLDLKKNYTYTEGKSILDYVNTIPDAQGEGGPGTFHVPRSWACPDQIYTPGDDDGDIPDPRQLYSQQPEKSSHPQSIQQHREKHKAALDHKVSLILKKISDLPKDFDLWQNMDGIECSYDKKQEELTITWSKTLVRNEYMLRKGYRIAGVEYPLENKGNIPLDVV